MPDPAPDGIRSFLRQAARSSYIGFFDTSGLSEAAWLTGIGGAAPAGLEHIGGGPRVPARCATRDYLNGLSLYRANMLRHFTGPAERRTRVPIRTLAPTHDAFMAEQIHPTPDAGPRTSASTDSRAATGPRARSPRPSPAASRPLVGGRIRQALCLSHAKRPRPMDGACFGTPERIRTAVTALRGRRPGPLDDGGPVFTGRQPISHHTRSNRTSAPCADQTRKLSRRESHLALYPRADSNRRYRLERAASWATRRRGRHMEPWAPRSHHSDSVRAMELAGVPGLEPRLSEPESLVLPITPYPSAFGGPGRSRFPVPLGDVLNSSGLSECSRTESGEAGRGPGHPVPVSPRRGPPRPPQHALSPEPRPHV